MSILKRIFSVGHMKLSNSESEVRLMSKYLFKKAVNTAIRQEVFKYLQQKKSSHSKVLHIDYNCLKLQSYFQPQKMHTQLAYFSFICRTRMLQVGANFKGKNSNPVCPLCQIDYDSQNHLLECPKLVDLNLICQNKVLYEDLFSPDLVKMTLVVTNLNQNYKKRLKLLKKSQ